MLVLFDIDGTLLKSQHAGVHAMLDAFHQLHPDRRFSFDGVDIAGRLDTLIYQEMTARHGVPAGQEHHETFRHVYSRNLESRLADRNTVVALEGVHELVPGLTGWAQVNGRDELPIPQKVQLDVEYLERRSLLFDMKILWMTALKVLASDGVSH